MPVDDVAMGGEEAWVARLQGEQLVPWRPQNGEIVRRHDHMAKSPIDERAVWHLELDAVAWLDRVDVGERSEERRAMPGDVHEAALPRHVRAEVSARPAFERRVIGPVYQHHVQAEAGNEDPSDRLSHARVVAEASRG